MHGRGSELSKPKGSRGTEWSSERLLGVLRAIEGAPGLLKVPLGLSHLVISPGWVPSCRREIGKERKARECKGTLNDRRASSHWSVDLACVKACYSWNNASSMQIVTAIVKYLP